MLVTVITSVDLGWDCVVTVVKGDEDAAREWLIENHVLPNDTDPTDIGYVFTETTVD